MIKRGILLVPGIVFSAGDIDDVMRDVTIGANDVVCSFFRLLFICVCTLCTIA